MHVETQIRTFANYLVGYVRACIDSFTALPCGVHSTCTIKRSYHMKQSAVARQHGAEGNLSEHAWVHPRTKQAWPEQQCAVNMH
jgi:hypothetical protein